MFESFKQKSTLETDIRKWLIAEANRNENNLDNDLVDYLVEKAMEMPPRELIAEALGLIWTEKGMMEMSMHLVGETPNLQRIIALNKIERAALALLTKNGWQAAKSGSHAGGFRCVISG